MADNNHNDISELTNSMIELDIDVIHRIFKRIKCKGILSENQKYSMVKEVTPIEDVLVSGDFIDKIKAYRIHQNISMRSVAQYIGKDDESYRMYEAKYNDIQDYKIAEKIIKFLNLENILELPDYFKIMKMYSKENIIEIANKYGKKQFSLETKIPIGTINYWNQKNNIKRLSTDTYKRVVPFFDNHNIKY